MDTDSEIIYSYTWDNAIADGTFIRIPEALQKEAGIKYPCAVTANLYHSHIAGKGRDVEGRLWDLLWMFRASPDKQALNESLCQYTLMFGRDRVTVWVACEARSPANPEPILTFMLPEDR